MSRTFNVAVLGATGAVGETMLSLLESRDFPVNDVFPLASSRSAGQIIRFKGQDLKVIDVETFDFTQAEIGLFSAGASVSERYAEIAAAAGCVVIDNTSRFRYDDDIPLVVPEVNPEAIALYKRRGIIANPNCSTIQMLVALKPLYDAVGIERINVCTYQAVSGTGKQAIQELVEQTTQHLSGKPMTPKVYPRQIAFNVLPQIDIFLDNGYTKEEMKMVWETQKIMEDPNILVNPTCVRVPVFYSHSEAIHIETRQKISVEEVRALLEKAPGVKVMDEQKAGGYPTPIPEGTDSDATWVGRIRKDISHPNGIDLWVVSDNLRKGAALNSVQIAEVLIKDYI